jgi:hypothetical protein
MDGSMTVVQNIKPHVYVIAMPSWRATYAAASRANVVRWNTIAEMDRANVVSFLSSLASQPTADSV